MTGVIQFGEKWVESMPIPELKKAGGRSTERRREEGRSPLPAALWSDVGLLPVEDRTPVTGFPSASVCFDDLSFASGRGRCVVR